MAQMSDELNTNGCIEMATSGLLWAVRDLRTFCGYGLFTKTGKTKPWPKIKSEDGSWRFIIINGIRDPHEHKRLKHYFLHGEIQRLCDWVQWEYPADEMFWRIVKREGANK